MACSIMVMQMTVNHWTAGSSPATPVASIAQRIVQCFCKAKVVCSNQTGGIGQVSEWLKEAGCKSAGSAYNGSNPFLPIRFPI